jgi:CheY-like chemotaxis protein
MKILIVDDRDNFRSAAEQYFQQRTDVQVAYARDYDEAMESLLKGEYDGALVDCFFPKKRGSNEITLGIEACDRLEAKVNESLQNENKCNNINIQTIKLSFGRKRVRNVKEYVNLIRKGMESYDHRIAEEMQPLGILMAEEIEKKGIPFLLATNGHHHGGINDIICVYQRLKDWPEIQDGYDGEGKYHEKNSPVFWEIAYKSLEKILKLSQFQTI